MGATNEFIQRVINALEAAKVPPAETSDEAFRAALTILTSTLLCEKLCGCEQDEKGVAGIHPLSVTVKPPGPRPAPDELPLMISLALKFTEPTTRG